MISIRNRKKRLITLVLQGEPGTSMSIAGRISTSSRAEAHSRVAPPTITIAAETTVTALDDGRPIPPNINSFPDVRRAKKARLIAITGVPK